MLVFPLLVLLVGVAAAVFDPLELPPPAAWTNSGRSVARVTLATHLSAERVSALKVMRERWSGPLAISFYIRSAHDVEVFAQVVKQCVVPFWYTEFNTWSVYMLDDKNL
jgi:hypothetical protein